MTMPKQSQPSRLTKSIICILSTLCIITWVTFPASAAEDASESTLSSFGLTDEQFENRVKDYLGIPYRKGGTSKKGMDCSGFVKTVYDNFFGIELPPSSSAQFRFSGLEKIDTDEMQSGDLIFFANSKKKRINHVGIYMSDRQFIHASSTEGITVSSLDERYWRKRFVGTKRHMVMATKQDSHDLQFESELDIPVHEKGRVSFYFWDEFGFSGFAGQNDRNPGSFKPQDLDISLLYFNEIAYDHSLFDDFKVNVSASHEKFEGFLGGAEVASAPHYDENEGSSQGTAERLGFKLASDYTPIPWVSITPAITYFDYPQGHQDFLNAAQWSLGVNTLVAPSHNRWSLSMQVQYSEKDDFATIASPYTRFTSLDVAVKLGINLTDNLQLSVMGMHDKRTAAYGMNPDSLLDSSTISDLFMTFNFRY